MRESSTENRLVYQWLALMERQGVYNVDNKHQCHRANPRAIVQPFVWAPHFYGCLYCGRYHLCRLRVAECEVRAAEDGQLTCLHSWRLVKDPQSMLADGSHEQRQQLGENTEASMHATQQSRRVVGARRQQYSNSEQWQPHDPASVRDWSDEWQPSDTSTKSAKSATLAAEEVQNAVVNAKNEHAADAYWREYYRFLEPLVPVLPPPPRVMMARQQSTQSAQQPQPTQRPQRVHWTWDVETRDAVTHTLHEQLTRVLRQRARQCQTRLSRDAPQLVARLVQQLQQPFCNLLLLVQNAPSVTQRIVPSQLVPALLHRLCQAFVARDLADRPVSVWRPPQWLRQARDCVSVPATTHQKLLARALEDYREHAYWLRDFVCNHAT